MNRNKILSWVLVGTFIGNPLFSGTSYALSDDSESEDTSIETTYYESSAKIQKFLGWEQKILAFMTQDYKKTAMQLKSTDTKKTYTDEYYTIVDNIKNVFADAQYDYDYMLDSHIESLKKEIKTYKEFRKELMSLSGSSINPFNIPTEEITSVETGIVELQKSITASLKEAIDNYDKSDFKETGKMELNTEGSFGKVHISVEKYTSILSILTRSQEAQVTVKGDFTLNIPGSYEYNETTGEYEKTRGKVVTGDFSIDGSIKIVGQDMYLSLQNYSLNTNLTGAEKESLDKGMKELLDYKGKTIKIPVSSSLKNNTVNQAETLAQLKEVLGILEKNSLLTPYKKLGDVYSLTIKNSTIETIAAVYGQKVETSDMDSMKKEMKKMPLLYTSTGGKNAIFVRINENDALGTVSLSLQDNAYSFLVDVKNPTQAGEGVYILIRKDFLDAKILASGVNVTATYKDKNLSFVAEGFAQNLSIQGPLSDENTNINFTFNGKKVGNVTWKKVADTYTYDALFEITLSEILSKFHLNGESTVTRGSFPIVAPKDFIEKDLGSADTSGILSNLSDL